MLFGLCFCLFVCFLFCLFKYIFCIINNYTYFFKTYRLTCKKDENESIAYNVLILDDVSRWLN